MNICRGQPVLTDLEFLNDRLAVGSPKSDADLSLPHGHNGAV